MSIEIIALVFSGVMSAAFLLGLRAGIATLILLRPLCDRFFELSRFDVEGHLISYGAIVNVVVICVMVVNIGPIWRQLPPGLRTTWLPFLLMTFIAILYSPLQIDGARKFLTYVSFSAMFVFSFVLVRSERDVIFYLKLVILSSVLPVLYGLIQIASGMDWFGDSRIHSTFSHPNIFAFYIVLVIGAILFLLSSERLRISGHLRLFLTLYAIPLLVVLIMTKTRSAWVGCLVLFLIYGLVYDNRMLIIVFVAPVFALTVPAVSDRIMDLATGTQYIGGPAVMVNAYAWREILWESAWTFIRERPIFGYGLNSFPFYSPIFFPLERVIGTYAHNVYIQFLFETGLVGLISFFWIFWRCFAWLNRYWSFDKRGLTMAAAMMVVYLIACYSDNLFEYLSFNWCFWFTFGLIFAQCARYRASGMEERKTFGGRLKVGGTAEVPEPGLAG